MLDLLVQSIEKSTMRLFWEDIDRRIEFIRRCGAEPIVCLSYTPKPLLRDPRYPLVSPPKDWSLWKEIASYWEVWNGPNSPGFWRGSGQGGLEDYLRLYEASAKGALKADPTVKVGGPGLAGGLGGTSIVARHMSRG